MNGDNIICGLCLRSCEHLPNTLISHILIQEHLPLAKYYVKRHVAKRFRQELYGELCLSLVSSVKKAQTKLVDDNITPYILANFRGVKFRFFAKQPLVRVPYNMHKKHPSKTLEALVEEPVAKCSKPDNAILLDETITTLSEDTLTKQILVLLSEDYKLSEISLMLGVSKVKLTRQLKRIRNRVIADSDKY